MGSLLEELARREGAARRRIEGIREQIAELNGRLGAEEERLLRLVIARETVEEILGEVARLVEEPSDGTELAGSLAAIDNARQVEAVPLGVVTVPSWRPGMGVSVLPQAYRDAMEILVDAGRAMRAGQIAVAMGLPDTAAKREGLRSKLKRLVERGWLADDGPGLFAVTEQVVREIAGKPGGAGAGGIGSSPAR